MNKTDFDTFQLKLQALCQQYAVWVAECKQWKERPNANCSFTDFTIRAKIDDNSTIVDIAESRRRI